MCRYNIIILVGNDRSHFKMTSGDIGPAQMEEFNSTLDSKLYCRIIPNKSFSQVRPYAPETLTTSRKQF